MSSRSISPKEFPHKWLSQRSPQDFSEIIPNQRYLEIVKLLVKPEKLQYLLNWLSVISEQNKKGLRVIKKVLDLQGAKKLKLGAHARHLSLGAVGSVAELPLGVALNEFWKVNSVSSYSQNYGQYHEDRIANRYKNLS